MMHVVLFPPNRPSHESYCIGQLAIFQAGGAYVPLHTQLPPALARYMLEDSSCRQAVVHPRFRPALEPDLRALGVEIVELAPEEGCGAKAGGEGEEEEVEFLEGGPVRPSTDAMVIYTRCVGQDEREREEAAAGESID